MVNYLEFDPYLAISDECLWAGPLYRPHRAVFIPPPSSPTIELIPCLLC